MIIKVNQKTLLSLSHLIHFGLSFNNFNSKLDKLQKQHFNAVDKDVLIIRDPFTLYKNAQSTQEKIWKICEVKNIHGVIDKLNSSPGNNFIEVNQDWLISAMHDAVTRYRERYSFFMIEHEYHFDLIKELGEEVFKNYLSDSKALLGKHLVCGNADQSERIIKEYLEKSGFPYSKPSHPYMEKHDARFAHMKEIVRKAIENQKKRHETNK